jgi:hypothetical protein
MTVHGGDRNPGRQPIQQKSIKMNNYSLDILIKLAFEREIDRLKFSDCEDKERLIEYLNLRIKEIKDQYKDW